MIACLTQKHALDDLNSKIRFSLFIRNPDRIETITKTNIYFQNLKHFLIYSVKSSMLLPKGKYYGLNYAMEIYVTSIQYPCKISGITIIVFSFCFTFSKHSEQIYANNNQKLCILNLKNPLSYELQTSRFRSLLRAFLVPELIWSHEPNQNVWQFTVT